MEGPVRSGDASGSRVDRELADLRARAYGPDADISDDPLALARLIELEAARRPPAMPATRPEHTMDAAPPAAHRSPEPDSPDVEVRRNTRRTYRAWLVATAAAVGLILAYAVGALIAPHPDASLAESGRQPDRQVFNSVWAQDADVDMQTLRAYEPYRGMEPWVALNRQGAHCLLIAERSTGNLLKFMCAASGEDLAVEVGSTPWHEVLGAGLPAGTIVRFQLRGEVVEAFAHQVEQSN